jgi:hypothetical protein
MFASTTGKSFSPSTVHAARVDDGKLVSAGRCGTILGTLIQLGIIDPPGASMTDESA